MAYVVDSIGYRLWDVPYHAGAVDLDWPIGFRFNGLADWHSWLSACPGALP